MHLHMTPKLRQALTEGYESERENWGDTYTQHFIDQLAQVPDGTALEGVDEENLDELELDPAASAALGVDYFFGGFQGWHE